MVEKFAFKIKGKSIIETRSPYYEIILVSLTSQGRMNFYFKDLWLKFFSL